MMAYASQVCECSAPGSPDTSLLITRRAAKVIRTSLACPSRGEEPVLLNSPLVAVILYELADAAAHVVNAAKDSAVDGLLVDRPIESPGHPLGLRLLHEGEARLDAPEALQVDEAVDDILAAVIGRPLLGKKNRAVPPFPFGLPEY